MRGTLLHMIHMLDACTNQKTNVAQMFFADCANCWSADNSMCAVQHQRKPHHRKTSAIHDVCARVNFTGAFCCDVAACLARIDIKHHNIHIIALSIYRRIYLTRPLLLCGREKSRRIYQRLFAKQQGMVRAHTQQTHSNQYIDSLLAK